MPPPPPPAPDAQAPCRAPPPDRRGAGLGARPGGGREAEGATGPRSEADRSEVGRVLVGEIGLTDEQASAFIAVTVGGRMAAAEIAEAVGIAPDAARAAAESLIAAGAFIDMPGGLYEAMHPRFTAVNMYRRACERSGRPFGRNATVDMVGAALEGAYDKVRTG